MKNLKSYPKLKLTLITLLLFLSKSSSAQYNKYFKTFIHFKIEDTSNISLPDFDTTYLGVYPQIQDLIDSSKCISISKPYNIIDTATFGKIYLMEFEDTLKVDLLIHQLNLKSWISFAEKVPKYSIQSFTLDPKDTMAWHLDQIRLADAFNFVGLPGNNIKIAVIDNAFRTDHEDLTTALYNNTAETINGFDDDNNGYIDDISGWDCADEDNFAGLPVNYNGLYVNHGTMTAGIPCAIPDNSKGTTGTSFGSKLIPIKLISDTVVNNSAAATILGTVPATLGMTYAIQIKADIVNMSFAGRYSSVPIIDSLLIEWGHNNGIIWVAAAANDNNDYTGTIYPNSFAHVISVGATNAFGEKASYSNYGPKTKIDVFAPGHGMPVPDSKNTNAYSFGVGTSAAAPFMAGIIALAKSIDSSLTFNDIKDRLNISCQNNGFLDPLHSKGFGKGLVDAYAFIRNEKTKNILWNTQRSKRSFCENEDIKLRISKVNQCIWRLKVQNQNDSAIIDTLVSDTAIDFSVNQAGRYNLVFICHDSVDNSIIYHTKFFPLALNISKCNEDVPYKGFSLWHFGKKSAIAFTSKGPRAAFNNDIYYAGNTLSICDYGGKYRWFGGLNNDSSKIKIIGHDFNKNSDIYKFHSHVVALTDPNFPYQFQHYQPLIAITPRNDTNNIQLIEHTNPQDFDALTSEAFKMTLYGNNTSSYNESKLNYYGYNITANGASAVQNGLQLSKNPNGAGWYVFFMGERNAYPAQKQIYAAFISDTPVLANIIVTDSINTGILAFRTDENKFVVSPQCDKLMFYGNGFVEWASSPTVDYKTMLVGFNPETGKFTQIIDTTNNIIASAAFSFSGDYLYTFELDNRSDYYLYQNKLTDTTIVSKRLVAHLESKEASGMQLGPDKSIYINPGNVDYVGIIKYPEFQNITHLSNQCGFYRKEVSINYNDTTAGISTDRNTGYRLPMYCFDPIEELNDTINYLISCDSIRFYNNGSAFQKWYFQGDSAYGNNVSFKIRSLLVKNSTVAKTYRGEWTKRKINLPMPSASWVVQNCSTLVVNSSVACSTYYSVVYIDSNAIDSMKSTYVALPGILPTKLSVRFLDSFFQFTVDFPDSSFGVKNLHLYPNKPAEISINTTSPFPYVGVIAFRNGVYDSVNFKYNRTAGVYQYYRFYKPGIYILHRLTDCGSMPFDSTIVRYACDSANLYDSVITNNVTTLPPFGLILKNKSYLIRGDWDVENAKLKISNALVVFDTCKNFAFGHNNIIEINNSELTGCKTWSGIIIKNPISNLIVAGSEFSFAQAAIQNYKGNINVTHSYFGANSIDIVSYDTASKNHITYDSFTNNFKDSGIYCSLLIDSLLFSKNLEAHFAGKNLKTVYIKNNHFVSHTPAMNRMFTLYADNCDSLDFTQNSYTGNADTGIFVLNCKKPWVRAGYTYYKNNYSRLASPTPKDSCTAVIFHNNKSVKHYDYNHNDWHTAIEFYLNSTFNNLGTIQNNIFNNCHFATIAASNTNPLVPGSSAINNLSDSVQLANFCNEYNNSHIAFIGLGMFPPFQPKPFKTSSNEVTHNLFNNCENAFFVKTSGIKINYKSYDGNTFERAYINNQTNGHILLNDTHYFNLQNCNLNDIKIINPTIQCGINPEVPNITNIKDIVNREFKVNLYPNPTNGKLNIISDSGIEQVSIFNTIGNEYNVFLENKVLDITTFPAGIYLIRITNSKGQYLTFKISKH